MRAYRVLLLPIILAVGATAHAGVVAQVNVSDDIYGPFAGSINDSDSGPAATLFWNSAVFGAIFQINFTNQAGIITDVLFSNAGHPGPFIAGDSLEFDGFRSGNPLIGTACVAGG